MENEKKKKKGSFQEGLRITKWSYLPTPAKETRKYNAMEAVN